MDNDFLYLKDQLFFKNFLEFIDIDFHLLFKAKFGKYTFSKAVKSGNKFLS